MTERDVLPIPVDELLEALVLSWHFDGGMSRFRIVLSPWGSGVRRRRFAMLVFTGVSEFVRTYGTDVDSGVADEHYETLAQPGAISLQYVHVSNADGALHIEFDFGAFGSVSVRAAAVQFFERYGWPVTDGSHTYRDPDNGREFLFDKPFDDASLYAMA